MVKFEFINSSHPTSTLEKKGSYIHQKHDFNASINTVTQKIVSHMSNKTLILSDFLGKGKTKLTVPDTSEIVKSNSIIVTGFCSCDS